MSEFKCPFCNGELVGTIGHPICRNQNCVMCDDPMPQDLLEELDRTRKALDVAVDAIKSAKARFELINNSKFANLNNVLQIQSQCEILKIEKSLEQIIALEQKDVK